MRKEDILTFSNCLTNVGLEKERFQVLLDMAFEQITEDGFDLSQSETEYESAEAQSGDANILDEKEKSCSTVNPDLGKVIDSNIKY